MDAREQILSAPMGRLCLQLSWPAIAGVLLMGAATFADAAFVGLFAGSDELGAILLSFPITMVCSAIAALIGSGAAALVSRALGASDVARIRLIGGAVLGWTLVASLLSAAVIMLAAPQLLTLLGAEDAMLVSGVPYTRVVFAGSPFMNFVFAASFLIRGEGRVRQSMVLLGAGSMLNVVLDGVFVVALSMGAVGAGWATFITQVVTAIATAFYLLRMDSRLEARHWRPNLALFNPIVRDGSASSLLYVMALVQQAIVFRVVASWASGDDVVFVGAFLRLMMIAAVPAWGIAMAMQPVVGINHGAGNHDRVRESVKVFAVYATLSGAVVWALLTAFPVHALGAFIDNATIIVPRVDAFRLLLLPFPLLGLQLVAAALLVGVGHGNRAAAILLARNFGVLLPLALLLPLAFGLDGVWMALVATDVVCFAMAIYFIRAETLVRASQPHTP
jgi:putative MATE family efflux protein